VIDRRAFITMVSGSILATPLAAEAQQAGKVWRIGFHSGGTAAAAKPAVEQFRQGLRELDYVEGQNITIEYRWADGQLERLPQLATDLARLGTDLIVAVASQAALATRECDHINPYRHGLRR